MPNLTRNAPQNSTRTRKPGRPVNPPKAKPVGRLNVAPERVTVKQSPRPKPERGTSYPWR